MPILPPLQTAFDRILNATHSQDQRSPAEQRTTIHAMMDETFAQSRLPTHPLPIERDLVVPVDSGKITVRIYSPVADPAGLPVHVYFHGGGFWLGTLDQFDGMCRDIAQEAQCMVVAVDYRLAPEHKFPVPVEDSYAALLWVRDNIAGFGGDPARIAVGGGSAGGNLAAAVAIMARDRGGPQLSFQLLEIPVTDFTAMEPLRFDDEGITVPNNKGHYKAFYLRNEDDARNPLASPLLTTDLNGLPPALVMCCEYDPLQPEGEAYARRLKAAGVSVKYLCLAGQFHGSTGMTLLIPEETAAYRAQAMAALRDAFSRPSS